MFRFVMKMFRYFVLLPRPENVAVNKMKPYRALNQRFSIFENAWYHWNNIIEFETGIYRERYREDPAVYQKLKLRFIFYTKQQR